MPAGGLLQRWALILYNFMPDFTPLEVEYGNTNIRESARTEKILKLYWLFSASKRRFSIRQNLLCMFPNNPKNPGPIWIFCCFI